MAGLPIVDALGLQLQTTTPVIAVTDSATPRAMRNVGRYTEDLSWAYYGINGGTKTGNKRAAVVDGMPITLSEITLASFVHGLSCLFKNATLAPFTVGARYLHSYYIYSDTDAPFYARSIASTGGTQGHGMRWVRGGRMRRVWGLSQALTTAHLDQGRDATKALGTGEQSEPFLLQSGPGSTSKAFWIGGIQYEVVPPGTKNGIALIGDSTMAGGSGKYDAPKNLTDPNLWEVSTHIAAALNCEVYNRAVGGEKLTDMDTRFVADMVPLFARSKYLAIQGGINDIGNGSTLAQCQGALLSMIGKAEVAGWSMAAGDIKIFNCTPTTSIASVPAYELVRQQFNAWLAVTFGSAVYDIATAVASPWDQSALHPAYKADGIHYPGIAKEAVAAAVLKQGGFVFVQPSTYQRQLG